MDDKNFGLDEILQIGTTNSPIRVLSKTKEYIYTDILFSQQPVQSFTGIFTGSLIGNIAYSNGTILGTSLMFSASYFSGSIDGNIIEESGSVSGSLVDGIVSGSIVALNSIGVFMGQLTGSYTCFTGTGSGIDTRQEENWITTQTKFIDRALLYFNLSTVSESIVNGEITDPHFFLNLKVCNEYDLPIGYSVYALALDQPWNMGNGYLSDGGSDTGVSWAYIDNKNGNQWYSPYITDPRIAIDFITTPSLATASFGYGGGTWNTTSYCSQSFNYKSSDINMDITSIVNKWLNGTIPNYGLLLVHSDELQSTGSGFILKYFSCNTNTIYSPNLDVAWDNAIFVTGSVSTGSVEISTRNSGITSSIQSGSSFFIGGGVSGSFSGSAVIYTKSNFITASEQVFNYYGADVTTNNTWYANNGYHYDSWHTAWQLDPYHGGFLPNTEITEVIAPTFGSPPILQFTGSFTGSFHGSASYVSGTFSGSGIFSTEYFSGSIDGVPTEFVGAGEVSGSLIDGFIGGTISNGAAWAASEVGIFTGEFTSPLAYLTGTGSGYYLDSTYHAFDGFVNGNGLSGNIAGIPVFGSINGLISNSQSLISGACGNSFSASLAKSLFVDGPFSGSTFTAYYINSKFTNAQITGSWNSLSLLGSDVNVIIPSGIDPYAYANVRGTYMSGNALGVYVLSGSTSASFYGQFVDGNLLGGTLSLQLSGSVYTSNTLYTSSINMISSELNSLDIKNPFSINIRNVQPQYKMGDIIKIDVFGRKKFPLKHFGKSTQQEQYMIPEFLPSSSYYALKDNQTEEMVIDFDSYTRISCDYPNGNYFIIDTTGLSQERYYRVLIRVQDNNEIYTIDTGKIFKVIR